ncbi:MAG: hypothetical protein ISQ14_12005 [Verrucomicrobiae bacterium]|nr:hypothetical protein [Verrucomicrobiae bacterium]
MQSRLSAALAPFLCSAALLADGPADNRPENVRPVPPPGIEVPEKTRTELRAGADQLGRKIEDLRLSLAKKTALLDLLPDVEIYHKAVDWALRYNQFYGARDFKTASELLAEGGQRADELRSGTASWLAQTGLVVRGYRSAIDGSVQPYGLVVPPGFVPGGTPKRLDFWFHGRGEKLSELSFIEGRRKSVGQFAPSDTFVLHPYGRYSCANKFAGEIDLFEALAHARKYYPIDERRIAVRGFSMGGAACWQFAVHYPGEWFAAAPGAGFSETPEFLRVFQGEELKPTWYERKLWHLYDCVDYAVNLHNLPTVAYSGSEDRQKQAADIMESHLAKEGIKLTHLIGPGMGHKYHPDAVVEIERRLASIAQRGRNPAPQTVKFATYTLRYNRSHWVQLDALGEHWERAVIDAAIVTAKNELRASTTNINAVTFAIPSGFSRFDLTRQPTINIDNQKLTGPRVESDLSWTCHLGKVDGRWTIVDQPATTGKRHGLQGPIDDAFMSGFLFVSPSGDSPHPKVQKWVNAELPRARKHWQLQFRGDARVKADKDVTDEDIASHNLVLWGDRFSNALIARLADKLPLEWTRDAVVAGKTRKASSDHVLTLICPNPLNPDRYVVLNSGFTYREYAYLNNARQIPMLPDWAIVDLNTPPNAVSPGRVAEAGFFGEDWRFSGNR